MNIIFSTILHYYLLFDCNFQNCKLTQLSYETAPDTGISISKINGGYASALKVAMYSKAQIK